LYEKGTLSSLVLPVSCHSLRPTPMVIGQALLAPTMDVPRSAPKDKINEGNW
jgi:hypothetical protein